ncbi:MAG: TrkA family potassium uptake protein, partial [Firmicutes bacterium]|nr:TrkA family potassium uptake protein [Bacillota bacterium]
MKTFAVIGLGRFGRTVASQLFSMGYEVLAVDINEELVNDISPFVTYAAAADAKDEAVLKELGVRNYDCAVVGITENLSDSILITLLLKEMGVKRVLCKALDENHKKILDKIGADYVIIPEDEVGVKTALHLASNSFFDWAELSSRYGIGDI